MTPVSNSFEMMEVPGGAADSVFQRSDLEIVLGQLSVIESALTRPATRDESS